MRCCNVYILAEKHVSSLCSEETIADFAKFIDSYEQLLCLQGPRYPLASSPMAIIWPKERLKLVSGKYLTTNCRQNKRHSCGNFEI